MIKLVKKYRRSQKHSKMLLILSNLILSSLITTILNPLSKKVSASQANTR